MKTSIPFEIVTFLETKQGFVAAGVIEEHIRSLSGGHKWETTGRRLRELAQAGTLDKCYSQVDGKGARFVCYRLVEKPICNVIAGVDFSRSLEQLKMI